MIIARIDSSRKFAKQGIQVIEKHTVKCFPHRQSEEYKLHSRELLFSVEQRGWDWSEPLAPVGGQCGWAGRVGAPTYGHFGHTGYTCRNPFQGDDQKCKFTQQSVCVSSQKLKFLDVT